MKQGRKTKTVRSTPTNTRKKTRKARNTQKIVMSPNRLYSMLNLDSPRAALVTVVCVCVCVCVRVCVCVYVQVRVYQWVSVWGMGSECVCGVGVSVYGGYAKT